MKYIDVNKCPGCGRELKFNVHTGKRHRTGEECFGGGWFIVMANLPTGQVSNHYELKDWDLFKVPEKEIADEWDGHTPQEAAERIHKYLQQEQPEADLDREIIKYKVPFADELEYLNETTLDAIARHFAEWGAINLNVKKEDTK